MKLGVQGTLIKELVKAIYFSVQSEVIRPLNKSKSAVLLNPFLLAYQ